MVVVVVVVVAGGGPQYQKDMCPLSAVRGQADFTWTSY
jgi:hypothetical protein